MERYPIPYTCKYFTLVLIDIQDRLVISDGAWEDSFFAVLGLLETWRVRMGPSDPQRWLSPR